VADHEPLGTRRCEPLWPAGSRQPPGGGPAATKPLAPLRSRSEVSPRWCSGGRPCAGSGGS